VLLKVGDPESDHKCWERPESMTEKRPLMQVNMSFPGTEVAAAMASASLVFKKIDFTILGRSLCMPNSCLFLLILIEVHTVSASPKCRNTTTPQDMKMNSCGQQPGSIMQPETNHTSNM
jgi:hypothetical protein